MADESINEAVVTVNWGEILTAWAKFIGTVGFPIVMCLYFMAKDAGWIPSPTLVMASEVRQLITAEQPVLRLVQQICINTTPKGDQASCLQQANNIDLSQSR